MNALLFIFLFTLIIQLTFWLLIVGRFNKYKEPKSNGKTDKARVSVVVVLKNGASYLPSLIKSLQEQDYPDFEMVFVDDHSVDDSQEIILNAQKEDDRIKYFNTRLDKPGKKQSLIEVLPQLKSPILLFTDVDCLPASDQWIIEIVSGFTKEKSIVIGYGPMFPDIGIINLFSRYETFMTAVQYFSWTLWGMPYMAVGRNMAYRRELFNKEIYNSELTSGDDDLFVQAKATKDNVAIVCSEESFVYSHSKSTISEFFLQKRRHASSSKLYKTGHQIVLSLFAGTQVLYFLTGIFLLLFSKFLWIVSLFMLLRQTVYYFSVRKSMYKLGEQGLVCRVFSLDLGLALYYIILAFLMLKKKNSDWN